MQEAAEAVFSAIAKERGRASWCESKAAVGGLPLNNFSVSGMPNSRFSETAISIIPGVAEKRTSNPLRHERKVDDVRQEAATVAFIHNPGGAGGAFFLIDPKDDMFTICLMQAPSQSERIRTDLKTLIYEALNR
jgi:hypothetical protein